MVKYGTDPNSLNQTAESPYEMGGGTHRVVLKNLTPGTTYYYQVVSGQGQGTGTQAQSSVGQFTTPTASGADKVPLYRAVSSNGSHLFTTSYAELNKAVASGGFKDEGIAGYIERTQIAGTEPLYRLYNPRTGDHFYTASASERNSATAGGYQDEGVAGYIFATQQPGTVPLYRLRNTQTSEHFYTTSANEQQYDLQHGWTSEGVAGYITQH